MIARYGSFVVKTSSDDKSDDASRILTKIESGLDSLNTLKSKSPGYPLFETYRADTMFLGFEALYEIKAAQVSNFIRMIQGLFGPVSITQKIKEGQNFLYGKLKEIVYADAFQRDIITWATDVAQNWPPPAAGPDPSDALNADIKIECEKLALFNSAKPKCVP